MLNHARRLNEQLKRWDFFGECILWDFHLTRNLGTVWILPLTTYGMRVGVSARMSCRSRSCMRSSSSESILFAWLQALTSGMKADPEMINWGFAEVARVEAFDSSAGCGLTIKWEGARRLDIEFSGLCTSVARRSSLLIARVRGRSSPLLRRLSRDPQSQSSPRVSQGTNLSHRDPAQPPGCRWLGGPLDRV